MGSDWIRWACTALFASSLWAACGSPPALDVDTRPRVTIVLAEAVPDRVERSLLSVLEARRDATLAARAGGTVVRRLVEPGRVVQVGQPLLEFDAREARAMHQAARAAVVESQAIVDDADRSLARIDKLGDGVSASEHDRAQTAVARARAGLELAQAKATQARVHLSHMTLVAPFDGEVAMLDPEVGETVPPGAPVARVVDVQGLALDVGLLEDEVAVARQFAPEFTVRHGAVQVGARIVHMAAAADPRTLTWTVRLELNAVEGLLAGMAVDVDAALRAPDATAVIPVEAVREGSYGLVVTGDQVQRRELSLVWERGSTVLVRGVEPGEALVVRGPSRLVDGASVVVVGE